MWAGLERAYNEAERICIDKGSKIVCMSDCHRGVGNRGDNFLPNENLFYAALQYYYDRCFTYIELGDGDELWENKRLEPIMEMHEAAFCMISKFYHRGRLLMLYGNHDCQKKRLEFAYADKAREAIVLEDCATGREIMLVHGHQGDLLNDTLWFLARFLVRYVWKPLERLGVSDPTSAARNYKVRKKTEKRLEGFAREKQILLMAGHTHRSVLPVPGESFYLNDGSCVHPLSITAMEIENGAIVLVKWSLTVRHNQNLVVAREVLEGPYPWSAYWNEK